MKFECFKNELKSLKRRRTSVGDWSSARMYIFWQTTKKKGRTARVASKWIALSFPLPSYPQCSTRWASINAPTAKLYINALLVRHNHSLQVTQGRTAPAHCTTDSISVAYRNVGVACAPELKDVRRLNQASPPQQERAVSENLFSLTDRVVLITGGNTGLGKAMALIKKGKRE